VRLGFSMEISGAASRLAGATRLTCSVRSRRRSAAPHAEAGSRATTAAPVPVLVGSADRPFKGNEETFDPAGPDAALDFDGGVGLELPALGSMLVEHVLELVAGHLAADRHQVVIPLRGSGYGHGLCIAGSLVGKWLGGALDTMLIWQHSCVWAGGERSLRSAQCVHGSPRCVSRGTRSPCLPPQRLPH
jgi:hypothetical protein